VNTPSASDITELAGTARLRLTDQENLTIERHMGDIFTHFASLEHVDVQGLAANPYAAELETVVRPDDLEPSTGPLPRGRRIVEAASVHVDGMFRVPRILGMTGNAR